MYKKVRFQDEVYWLVPSKSIPVYQLAPLDHFDEEGNLLVNPYADISFAMVLDGRIWRYGKIIGIQSDLKEVVEAEVAE